MTATQSAILALTLYSISNFMVDKYFSHVEPLVTAFIYSATIASVAFVGLLIKYYRSDAIVLPTGLLWYIIIACGVVCFFANVAYFTAYNIGGPGSFSLVTTVMAILPVLAALIRIVVDCKFPTLGQSIAAPIAVLAVWLATK